jgi:hypothetical protein
MPLWPASARLSKASRRRILPTRDAFFRFGLDPRRVDILPHIPGVDFDAAWQRRVETTVDADTGLKAFFISRDDLIAPKLAAGRPQDLADVDAIRKAASSTR